MGNFGPDTVRAMHKTDVALINGGTLRGNKVFSAGKVTRKELLEMHPFGNQVAKIHATGKELFDYINMNLDGWDTASGAFVQVSGLKYEFDHSKPAGQRLQKLTTEDGTEVDPAQEFTVAITDYMLSNSPLRHNKLYQMTTLNDAVPLVQSFVEAVTNAGDACYTAKLDGRIKDLAA
jgi:2',3'-cyclic-nucleotide 2'-phosphodiesterase (5'-nucleotidase family)